MRAFVFPGQGSQTVGMGQGLYQNFAVAREVFHEVDEALSEKLSALMFDGPAETLTETQNTQPALMAVSMAMVRVLEQEAGLDLKALSGQAVVAGHSLGETTALAATRVVSLTAAARLLRLRGLAMRQAFAQGDGAMAAVLGVSPDVMATFPEQHTAPVCVIANDNSSGQVVLSGHRQAVEAAALWVKAAGGKIVFLNVSGPFHSPLMAPAREAMAEALEGIHFGAPDLPILTNVSAAPQDDPAVLKDHLLAQLTGRVRWRETLAAFQALGVTHHIEIGSGTILTGLARRAIPDVELSTLHTPQDVDAFVTRIKGDVHV